MAFQITATSASRPVPDQIRIAYRLFDTAAPGVDIDTGSVTFTLPFLGADGMPLSQADRRQRIRDTFRQCVRERVHGMRAAAADFAAIQTAIAAGNVTVGEGD